MKVKLEDLRTWNACPEAIHAFTKQKERRLVPLLKKLLKGKKWEWANWLIVHYMPYQQYVAYGVFAAEQVIDKYERIYPNDNRLRDAIKAAKLCIENPSKKNRSAAESAAKSAAEAAYAVDAKLAAKSAAYAAANAAYAAYAKLAAKSAAYAAYAVDAKSVAYAAAAYTAAYTADDATFQRRKILNYGIKILEQT